jgi:hypothetical protein
MEDSVAKREGSAKPAHRPAGKLSLSPSVYHRRVMDETEQPLRYGGGDVKKWQAKLRPKLRG